MRARRVLVTAGTVAILAAGPVALQREHLLWASRHTAAGDQNDTAGTALATVQRRTLTSRLSLGGMLGYAGDYTVLGKGSGTITGLPALGRIVSQGQALYWVNGAPIILLYGSTPAYRTLAQGAKTSDVTGTDVQQLNRALVALGYADGLGLDPASDEFSWATKYAVKRMQAALGVPQTGWLELGQVVFLPGAVRVASVSATLGGPSGGEVLKATSTGRVVTVNLSAALQSQVHPGEPVTITLPSGANTPGRVLSVGKVATIESGSTTTTVEVDIAPTTAQATGTLDKAPVQVAIITQAVRNVLVVPVTALLALSNSGYGVELVAADGAHRLVPVTLGLFDDSAGMVQVAGSALTAGERVVVPAS